MAKDWWEEEDEEEEGGGLSYLKRLRRKSSGKGGVGHYLNEKKAEVAATGQTKLSDGTTYRSDKIAGEYNAEQNKEISDMVRGMGDYLTERREAETEPTYRSRRNRSNLLTPEMEAEFQRRNGRGNRLTPFQEYMRETMASMPEQEETRSTDELRRDMNRQNRLARATNRMAADMGNQLLRDQSGIYDPVRSTNLGVMARTMETQQKKADRATELYRTESTRRRWQEEQEKYASLLSNPDFAAKSGADETIGRNLTAASPAERLYRTITKRSDDKSNAKDRQAAEFVTDEEASIFYYLWNTQGARAAKAYYDDYVHNRASERRAVEAQRQAYEFGRNDMLGSSAESVVGNFASGVGLLDMAWQNLARSIGITDPNKPLNYYSAAQLPSLVSDSIRSGVADQLAEYFPKLSIGKAENATNVVSFLYQTGMSMADSGVSILLNMVGIPEAATLANMGAIAGTRAIRDAKERGATDGQALAFGISSAIMEGLFEKISLDKILEPSTATKFWPRVKNAIDQMFTEGSEEVMTTLANTAMDQLIMGDKSELFTRQRQLMEQGVSEKEALRAAMLQWGTEVLGDLLGGMISGLGMGGTKEIATGLRYAARDAQTAREMTDAQNREVAQAREQSLREAYEQAPQVPALTIPTQETQNARRTDPLQYALNKATSGETVSKQDARAIIENPQALQELRDSGVLTGKVTNDSEGRGKVVDAVNALAEQQRQTAEIQAQTENAVQEAAQNTQEAERPAPPVPSGMQQNTETGTETAAERQGTEEPFWDRKALDSYERYNDNQDSYDNRKGRFASTVRKILEGKRLDKYDMTFMNMYPAELDFLRNDKTIDDNALRKIVDTVNRFFAENPDTEHGRWDAWVKKKSAQALRAAQGETKTEERQLTLPTAEGQQTQNTQQTLTLPTVKARTAEPAQAGPPLPSRVTQEQESRAETPKASESTQGASEAAQGTPTERKRPSAKQQSLAQQRQRQTETQAENLRERGFTTAGEDTVAHVRSEDTWDAEEKAVAAALREQGIEPTFVTGLLKNAEGKRTTAILEGNRLAIQADNRSQTVQSIAEKALGKTLNVDPTAFGSAAEAAITARTETKSKPAKTVSQRAQATLDSARQYGVSDEDANTAARLADVLGKDIRFYSKPGSDSGWENGYTEDGVIYVNAAAKARTVTWVIGHELTHNTEHARIYQALQKLAKQYYGSQWQNRIDSRVAAGERMAKAKGDNGYLLSPEAAAQELTADYFAEKVLTDEATIRQIVKNDAPTARRIVSYLKNLLQKLKGKEPTIERAIDLYSRALKQAAQEAQEKGRKNSAEERVGIHVDEATESANAMQYSFETWESSDYVTDRRAAAEDLAKKLGVSYRKALKFIDDVNSIAKIIAEDQARLDYEASPGRTSFVGNTEYGGSIDFSTICKKRRLYTGTIEAIQKAMPNQALTVEEMLRIRRMMKDRGYEVSCGLCYVEGSRTKMGEFSSEFIELYKKHNPDAEWIPNMVDVNTPDGVETMRQEHPEVYKAYEYFWNHYGTLQKGDKNLFASQQKPKLYQTATAYNGEILRKFKNSKTVEKKNTAGGLRLQSFSDFEIIHLIDNMQVIMDMSRVGLAGQAYTKVPDFAWALGNTGLKINLSLIAKGVDENGNIVLDEVEGMKRADAEALRDAYSKNVGTILVTFTDEQLKAAMADPFIDFIIPFHKSQWSQAVYDAIGLPEGTKSYEDQQNESYLKQVYNESGKAKSPKNFWPNDYWDFSKTGKENAETYLKMCAEDNRRPKFYKLLVDNGDGSYSLQPDGSTDGYWKLLSDFKMYDNAGKGSPQTPVQPKFNMEQAERMLNEYTGGHQSFPVAKDVVTDFLQGKGRLTLPKTEKAEKQTSGLTLPSRQQTAEGKQKTESRLELPSRKQYSAEDRQYLRVGLNSETSTDYNREKGGENDGRRYGADKGRLGETGQIDGRPRGKDTSGLGRSAGIQKKKSIPKWENLSDEIKRAAGETVENYIDEADEEGRIFLHGLGEPEDIARRLLDRFNKDPDSLEAWAKFVPDIQNMVDKLIDITTGRTRIEGNSTATDAEYMAAVKAKDERTLKRLVAAAAEKWGAAKNSAGNVIRLFHGTPSFGFTEFNDKLIYATPDEGVAAGYGREGYADPRRISEVYTRDDGTDETLIKNAKNVLHKNYREINAEDLAQIKERFAEEARRMNDRTMDAWDYGESFPTMPENIENGLNWMLTLPGELTENINEIMEGGVFTNELADTIRHFDQSRDEVREWFGEHRNEILTAGNEALYKLVTGFDLTDFAIDVEYTLLRAIDRENHLIGVNGNLISKEDLRNQIEQLKNVGAYALYGNMGNKPLIIDAEGAFWSSVKAPMFGEGTMLTDDIVKKARKAGYTSVLIKNVMDPAMNNYSPNRPADDYVFFTSDQVKSADLITYDDNGNVIPLSERFNPKNDDIRYSAEDSEYERELGSRSLLATPALKKLGVKVSGSVGQYGKTESLIAKDRAAKSLQREARKAEKRLKATDAEKEFANGIAAGIYSEEDIPKRMNKDTVMELADYYFAENSANLETLHQLRSDINQGLRDEAQELLEDADIKPQSMLLLNERTPERSFRAMFGDRAEEISKWMLDPVRENEAEKIRWYNKQMDAVRKFKDSKGKTRELTRAESALTMRVMEGRAAADMVAAMETRAAIENAAQNIRNGEDPGDAAMEFSLSAGERDLAEKYAGWLSVQEELKTADSTIVEAAAEKYAQIFDDYYDAINDFLAAHGYEPIGYIKGYAPHMQPEENQSLLQKAFASLGINEEVSQLPASIAGMTTFFKPNKRWNPYFLQRTGDTAEYDIVKAYQSYVDYMADILYHTDDVMRIRQTANWIRKTYAPEEIRANLDWAQEMRNASTEEKQRLLRDAGEIGQNTVLSPVDTAKAMQDYIDKLYQQIADSSKNSNLVMWLDNYANILAGKQSFADRGWEYSTGRKSLNWANRLNNVFQKANVAGNLSSILNQTAQLPMIYAELGERDFLGAMADIVGGKTKSWAQDSDFLTAKEGKDLLYTDNADKFISALFAPAGFTDNLVSTIAVRGAFNKAIREGMSYSEAMAAADKFGQAVMGSRAKGSRPLAYESKGFFSKMVHMFQIEAVNSWDHLATDLPYEIRQIAKTDGKNKAARALAALVIRALLGAFVLNRLTDELYGGTPAPFDVLGLAANFVASGQGLSTNQYIRTIIDNTLEKMGAERIFETEKKTKEDFDLDAAAEELIYNVMNDIPLIRNAAGVMGLGDQTVPLPGAGGEFKNLATTAKALLKDGREEGEVANLIKAAILAGLQFVPGGRQISKTAQGAEALIRGGSYSGYKNPKLQYPLEGAADTAKALLFGKNATGAAQDYWAAGGKALTEKQTALYQSMVDEGMSRREAFETITGHRTEGTLDDYVKWTESRSRDAGIGEDIYLQFRADTKDITGDPDGKGGTISGSKKQKIVDYIDSLEDLTPDQKTAMLLDYNSTYSLKDLPWLEGAPAEPQETKPAAEPGSPVAAEPNKPAPTEPEKVTKMRGTLTELGLQGSKVDALAPVLGGDGSNTAKWRAVADQNLGKSQQDAVLRAIMTDSMYRNWTIASGENISLDDYVTGREAYVDLDNSGTDQNGEWTAALEQVTFDKDTARDNYVKGVLWQIYTGSTSTKNNPFDKAAGQKVLDAKNSGGGKSGGDKSRIQLPTQKQPWDMRSKPSSGLRIRAAIPAAQAPRSGLRIRAK